jgi:hypothetical protein
VVVQVTVLWPIENSDPAAGVQVVVTGVLPFATLGALNATVAPLPSTDCTVCAPGQVIFGGSGVGGTGVGTGVGVAGPAQPASIIAPATARTRSKPDLHTKRH